MRASPPNKSAEAQLSALEPAGLILRYAKGRLSYMWMRQFLTAFGTISVFLLISPAASALTLLLAVLGEVVDYWVLSRTIRMVEGGTPYSAVSRSVWLSAAFQGATIAACVLIVAIWPPPGTSLFYAFAFLAAAAFNAGSVWPFHPPSAIARLGLFAVTALAVIIWSTPWKAGITSADIFNLLAVILVFYVIYSVLGYVISSHSRSAKNARILLDQTQELQDTNASLLKSRNELRRLALVAKHANDAIIITDADRQIVWVNDAFGRQTGYDPAEALGKTPGHLFNGPLTDPNTVEEIAESVKAMTAFRGEILNYRKDGSVLWVDTNLVPVPSDEGNLDMVVGIERDITGIKQHEAELKQARKDAERGERAKSDFLATMSHEIRTPMNAIIGLSDLLEESDLSPQAREYASTIRSSGDALLTIINDVLDFSKLDAGQVSIDPVEFDPRACIDKSVQVFAAQVAQKGIYLDVVEEHPLPSAVYGDDGRLRQILLNLIGNALKFTEAGGITVQIGTQKVKQGHRLTVAVSDTGVGISKDRQSKIFDKFSQADGKTTREFGGTGLGLTISRLLARLMHGDISVDSTEGEGSKFTLTVVLEAAKSNSDLDAKPEDIDPGILEGLSILVAEDNKTNRYLIQKYLSDVPVSLSFAENGSKAVTFLRSNSPDLILMDMSMPLMDGLEATRRIRKMDVRQPHIIALTANAFDSDKDACFEAGMDDFLAKPVRKNDLIGKLTSWRKSKPANLV